MGTRLTDCISNRTLYKKYGAIPFSMAIIRKRLRVLGQVMRMKGDRLPKIVFGLPFKAEREAAVVPEWDRKRR